jgi:hypothetical protein
VNRQYQYVDRAWRTYCHSYDQHTYFSGILMPSVFFGMDTSLTTGKQFIAYVQILTEASTSALDLTFCYPGIADHSDWSILPDLYGSDHYPVRLHEIAPSPTVASPPNGSSDVPYSDPTRNLSVSLPLLVAHPSGARRRNVAAASFNSVPSPSHTGQSNILRTLPCQVSVGHSRSEANIMEGLYV